MTRFRITPSRTRRRDRDAAASPGRTSTFFQDSVVNSPLPSPRQQRSATFLVVGCGIALGSGSAALVALAPVLHRWLG